jgi:hypothetical protein
MTTIPHILTGAALASLLPTGSTSMKLLGFGLGFASHYILDAMPHWERLYGVHYNDELPSSYAKWPKHVTVQGITETLIGCAMFFVILVFVVPGPDKALVFLGGLGAVFPDLMDSVPWWSERTKRLPIWRYFTRFHDWAHLDYDLQRRLPSFLGLVSQIAVIIAALDVLLHS